MARPKPTILLEHFDSEVQRTEQVLEAESTWTVLYKDQPFNLRTITTDVSKPRPKYKKISFPAPGHAFNLAERMNRTFNTDQFTVHKMGSGELVVEITKEDLAAAKSIDLDFDDEDQPD